MLKLRGGKLLAGNPETKEETQHEGRFNKGREKGMGEKEEKIYNNRKFKTQCKNKILRCL